MTEVELKQALIRAEAALARAGATYARSEGQLTDAKYKVAAAEANYLSFKDGDLAFYGPAIEKHKRDGEAYDKARKERDRLRELYNSGSIASRVTEEK